MSKTEKHELALALQAECSCGWTGKVHRNPDASANHRAAVIEHAQHARSHKRRTPGEERF